MMGEVNIELTDEDWAVMPQSLCVPHADIFLITSEGDKPIANHLQMLLEQITYRLNGKEKQCKVHLLDDMQGINGLIDDFVEAQETSTVVFLFITRDFCQSGWANFQKNDALMRHIQCREREWSIVPLFTLPKGDIKVPNGLISFKGIDMSRVLENCSIAELDRLDRNDIYCKKAIVTLLESIGHLREEREKKQASQKAEWVRSRKLKVKRERASELERKRHQLQEVQDL